MAAGVAAVGLRRAIFRLPVLLHRVGIRGVERVLGIDWLLLTTTGRRSGRPHVVMLDSVGHDPASAKVQAAADRWLALTWRAYAGDPAVQTDSMTAWADRERWPARMQLESASGGDFEIHDALLRMWADREHWSASLRWQVEAIHFMPYERIQRVADFLDRTAGIEHP